MIDKNLLNFKNKQIANLQFNIEIKMNKLLFKRDII